MMPPSVVPRERHSLSSDPLLGPDRLPSCRPAVLRPRGMRGLWRARRGCPRQVLTLKLLWLHSHSPELSPYLGLATLAPSSRKDSWTERAVWFLCQMAPNAKFHFLPRTEAPWAERKQEFSHFASCLFSTLHWEIFLLKAESECHWDASLVARRASNEAVPISPALNLWNGAQGWKARYVSS